MMDEYIRTSKRFYDLIGDRIVRDGKSRDTLKKKYPNELWFGSFKEATDWAAKKLEKDLKRFK